MRNGIGRVVIYTSNWDCTAGGERERNRPAVNIKIRIICRHVTRVIFALSLSQSINGRSCTIFESNYGDVRTEDLEKKKKHPRKKKLLTRHERRYRRGPRARTRVITTVIARTRPTRTHARTGRARARRETKKTPRANGSQL